MKKQWHMNPKAAIIILSISSIIHLSGCSKKASILGSWMAVSERQITKTNNIVTLDTTYLYTPVAFAIDSVAFQGNGTYIDYGQGGKWGGVYSVAGSILTQTSVNTTYTSTVSISSSVLVLTSTDTFNLSPLTTIQYIDNYKKL